MSMPKVVIVGRPNVGKSTLFNRLCRKKLAIVDDTPGVTRDWRLHEAALGDFPFLLYDTPGLEGFESDEIKEQINKNTRNLLESADLILFVVDAKDGIVAGDSQLAIDIRALKTPKILLMNKAEASIDQHQVHEFHSLGLGDPVSISAKEGLGMNELYSEIITLFPDKPSTDDLEDEEETIPPLQLAIIGRPNVGKSTLINNLLGQERLITGDQPGITRDSIGIDWEFEGHKIKLVDTAGMRRKARIDDNLEKVSVRDSLRALKYAQVTILVLDSRYPLEKQDLTLASRAINEGRALIIALNKWDLDNKKSLNEVKERLAYVLPQIKGVPCIPVSAANGKNTKKLIQEALDLYELWNVRISTGELNRWLEDVVSTNPPPLSKGRPIKLKYMTQIKTRPPTFVLFMSKPTEIPASYLRYLENQLRQDFQLPGVPLRLYSRKGDNPYVKK